MRRIILAVLVLHEANSPVGSDCRDDVSLSSSMILNDDPGYISAGWRNWNLTRIPRIRASIDDRDPE